MGKEIYVKVNCAFKQNKNVYYITNKIENKFSIDIYDNEDWLDTFARVILRN